METYKYLKCSIIIMARKYLTTKWGLVDPDSMEYRRITQYNRLIARSTIPTNSVDDKHNIFEALMRVKTFFRENQKSLRFVNYGDFLASFSQGIEF